MKIYNKKWFSLIELLVAILIFSMWVVSVFSMIVTTLNLNDFNKNYLISASLSREQIELFRNIRDSNYSKIQIYNQINPNSDNHTNVFEIWKYYRIENDFANNTTFPVKTELIPNFDIGESEYITAMEQYRLCLNEENLYVYCKCNDWKNDYTLDCNSNYTPTQFFKYIFVDEVKYNDNGTDIVIDNALKVTSRVVWFNKWLKEFEMSSIFTDYKRF